MGMHLFQKFVDLPKYSLVQALAISKMFCLLTNINIGNSTCDSHNLIGARFWKNSNAFQRKLLIVCSSHPQCFRYFFRVRFSLFCNCKSVLFQQFIKTILFENSRTCFHLFHKFLISPQ